ncbi:MAG TPA: hypothetical protein VNK89_02000 [Thermoflexus sp.]|nr:hypothetical protein [Thermoflexus sp.]
MVLTIALFRVRLRWLAGDGEQADAAHRRAVQAAQASGVPQFLQTAQLEWLYAQAQSGASDRALLETLTRQGDLVFREPSRRSARCGARGPHPGAPAPMPSSSASRSG